MTHSRQFTVVVPTVGRASLTPLLEQLDGFGSRFPVVVVDDRKETSRPLPLPKTSNCLVQVVASGHRGPAAARNRGWHRADTPWVTFVDDDVELTPKWLVDLERDIADCPAQVAGVQGQVSVPLPESRRPTDWERNVAGLTEGRWITADMAYRRKALAAVGGFDERFRRAYREDADLALRLEDEGWHLSTGRRRIVHPVRSAPWWVSVANQRGNRDDVLMDRIHGSGWRQRVGGKGPLRTRHLTTTGLALAALALRLRRHRRLATLALSMWSVNVGVFTIERIAPGPRTPQEMATMAATSLLIPPAASFWYLAGLVDSHRRGRKSPSGSQARHLPSGPGGRRVEAVLFDRDGTLIHDVPYNGDPDRVTLIPGAAETVAALRTAGLRIGLVSNQSGIGRGLLTEAQVEAANYRLEGLVGPFDTMMYCPHHPDAGCRCRKPAPGLVEEAAKRLGVNPCRCVVVGDILSDVRAAEAAGGIGVLVPNAATDPDDIATATWVVNDLAQVSSLLLSWNGR